MRRETQFILLAGLVGLICSDLRAENAPATKAVSILSRCDSCRIVLVPPRGKSKSDLEISALQRKIKTSPIPAPLLDRLGWLLVAKARSTGDEGIYNLVKQTALCLEALEPESTAALLLRGHALQSLHNFKEAEPVARKLIEKRGASFDYGLLGDISMDRGQVTQGIEAYQKMMELKPDLHSYTRAAHARWLTGDVEGALELISMATEAGSSRNAEATAWSYSRRAAYELQLNRLSDALQSVKAALELQPDYAAALFFRGRIELAQGQTNNAVVSLQRAVKLNSLPEYQWLLADVLNTTGEKSALPAIELELNKRGALEDPRTFALYLTTRREKNEIALKLAERELTQREDVFTHDALAWALHATGKYSEAQTQSNLALSEGTEDARLFFHAAVIAHSVGNLKEALFFSQKANGIQQMLFPSEQKQLVELNGHLLDAQSQAKLNTSDTN